MGKPGPQPFNTSQSGQTVSSLPGQQRWGPGSRVLVFFYEFAVPLLINRVYNVKFSTFPWLIKYFLNELSAHPISVVMTFELSSSWLLGFSEFYADRKYRKKEPFSLYLKKDIVIHLPPSHRADHPSSVLRPWPTFPCTPAGPWNEYPQLGRNIVLTQPCCAPSPAVTLSQGPWCFSPAKKELLGSTPSITQAQNPKPVQFFILIYLYC